MFWFDGVFPKDLRLFWGQEKAGLNGNCAKIQGFSSCKLFGLRYFFLVPHGQSTWHSPQKVGK